MKPGQRLTIKLTDRVGQPLPLPGVILTLLFSMNGRHRYGFRSEASNQQGVINVSYENLEAARQRNLSVQPADFKTLLEDCDETMRILLPSHEELLSGADILETMGQGRWPDLALCWRKASNGQLRARELSVVVNDAITEIDLVCETMPPDSKQGAGS